MNPFANRLLDWWHTHGRHDLPWQVERTPYRVWVAEIMLQQTQVATVIGYFERFMVRFPNLESLARSELDEVLALWSGLGYYARARNLHAAAGICHQRHDAVLPDDAEALLALPGIGESTANAIIAQAFNRRAPILDGNVKRVLSRHAGIEGWPGRSAVARQLWQAAALRTPEGQARDYTQAIMDLGAMVCTPRRPACDTCPVSVDCVARREDRTGELPGRKPRRDRPRRSVIFAWMMNDNGELLLERRPPTGVWGGLWCLPAIDDTDDLVPGKRLDYIEHHFTHFILDIDVRQARRGPGSLVEESANRNWMRPDQALRSGLPKPVRQIIETLQGPH